MVQAESVSRVKDVKQPLQKQNVLTSPPFHLLYTTIAQQLRSCWLHIKRYLWHASEHAWRLPASNSGDFLSFV